MNQLYFKINLNKYGEEQQKAAAERRTFNNTAISFALIAALIIGFTFYLQNDLQGKIKNRKSYYEELKEKIKSRKASGTYLSTRDLERLAGLSTERIFWAKKLVALSERTTDKIAITHFSFKRDILSLYGITKIDVNQKEHDLVMEFIDSLKENKQISGDFPDIKFVKSRRDKEKDVDIIRFQIDCLTEGAGSRKGGRS